MDVSRWFSFCSTCFPCCWLGFRRDGLIWAYLYCASIHPCALVRLYCLQHFCTRQIMAGYGATGWDQKKLQTDPFVQVRSLDSAGRSDSERKGDNGKKPWRPVSLRYPFLLVVLASTLGLIAVLQYLLARSRRDQGILFADNINDLPISRTFGYNYAPTVISVVFGLLWTWIDLDVKRLEPFFQLSKPGGALAKDSILLEYPFDFAVTIPFKALKRRHWSVFLSATAVLLIFFGLTPTQAGIFAVRTVTMEKNIELYPAKPYIPLEQQGNLSAAYAQSVHNIAWLNESLPPFMTKDYILEAFGPAELLSAEHPNQYISGNTTMYSVDIACEVPTWYNNSIGIVYANSSNGCSYKPPVFRPVANNNTEKPYDAMYVGYHNDNGFADYYLSQYCPKEASQTFFARWSRSAPRAILSLTSSSEMNGTNATSLYCTSSYFQQNVTAIVSLPLMVPISVRGRGPKLPLPDDLFNASSFEWAMSSGQEQEPVRGPYPVTGFPEQKTHLQDFPLNLAYLPKMASIAIGANPLPAEEYLNADQLAQSYRKAYRMLFARRMVDILNQELNMSKVNGGSMPAVSYETQAVVVVPEFIYAATVILAVVAVLGFTLLFHLWMRPNKLNAEPGSIRALMSLTKGSAETVVTLSGLDRSSAKELRTAVADIRFALAGADSSSRPHLRLLGHVETHPSTELSTYTTATLDEVRGVRPDEMKLSIGATFFALQVIAAVIFATLHAVSIRYHGLPLPSKATITRQVLENYIPVAFATLAEPFWLVLNRLLCLLQPYEQLQSGNARASRSVGLNYSSLPPQLVFLKALKARHILLALVCLVAIAMNALAVALSGIMYEDIAQVSASTDFESMYVPVIQELNATGLPFNSAALADTGGGNTREQFYRDMSNLTAGTPLPPWTDGRTAWLPVRLPDSNVNTSYTVSTPAFGVSLQCQPLENNGLFSYSLTFDGETSLVSNASSVKLNTSLPSEDRSNVILHCHNAFQKPLGMPINTLDSMPVPPSGRSALELGVMLSNDTNSIEDVACRQYIVAGWLRTEWQNVTNTRGRPSKTKNSIGGRYGEDKIRLKSLESTLLLCKPIITYAPASTVTVDHAGHVQQPEAYRNQSWQVAEDSPGPTFRSGSESLVAQVNQFLVDNGATWHQDAFPSDWTNYLLMQHGAIASLLDFESPPPAFVDIAPTFARLYARLFAILVSTNYDLLFKFAGSDTPKMSGKVVRQEVKIFVSFPAFVVAECVLGFCMLATVLLYAKRKVLSMLPRLPTNVASTIAFFAASTALREMDVGASKGIQDDGEWRWGFGQFVGADAKRHIGIERALLVTPLRSEDLVPERL